MQFRRPTPTQASINIAPLVDVVFLLVIFFAVSTTFLDTAGLKLELPASSSTAQRETSELVVLLSPDGEISFDGQTVDHAVLKQRLTQQLASREGEARQVVLRADREARHGDVVAVMDAIQGAGAAGLRVDARATGE